MSILRIQSFFPLTLVLLVSLISPAISVSRAQIIDHVSQSTSPSSTIPVSDVLYTMPDHSTTDPSSFLSAPTPTTQSPAMGNNIFGAVRIDISGRDDLTSPSSSESVVPLDSSTVEPPPSISTLLLSSTTPVSVSSESSTATPRDTTVPMSAVVGGAVGGSVVLIAFIVFIFVTRRQRGPRIEPFPFEADVERHESRERHGRQMSQHTSPAPDVPIIRPPARKQSHVPSPHPLLQSGTKLHALYDHKVSVSATSLHGTTLPEMGRTFSHSGDAASVISRESDWRRHRPLPRPPTDKPPPVPDLPRALPSGDIAVAGQPTLTVPNHSLASSAPLSSPISPLDIDLADYSNPSTSPLTFSPARRDSQLEPARSPRRLPAPPVWSPPTPSVLTVPTPVESEGEGEASLHFDADGRPDSPSVAKMYAELLALQRQVARLREDMPARHFGEAPPDYAESVVGSVCA